MGTNGLLSLSACWWVASLCGCGCGGHATKADMGTPDLAIPDLTMPDAIPEMGARTDMAVPPPDMGIPDMNIRDLLVSMDSSPTVDMSRPDLAPAPHTIVSLEFDDGWADQSNALDLLSAHGFHATFYIISGKVGAQSYFDRDQIAALAAAGHEIGGHTLTHPDLTTLTADQARSEVCDDRTTLQSWGYDPISFAYPYGAANASVEQIVADCGYQTARGVGGVVQDDACGSCPAAESLPPQDPFYLRTPGSARINTSLAMLEGYVTQTEMNGGGWVHIVMHHVCDGCDTYSISRETLGAFLDWLAPRQALGTVVLPIAEAMRLGRLN